MLHRTVNSFMLLTALAGWPLQLTAQTFSYDGNRWYEIEVSIFTNEDVDLPNSELAIPENTSLEYPQDIRRLVPAIEPFAIDFDSSTGSLQRVAPQNDSISTAQNLPVFGPEFSPADASFEVTDFSRDPFIALSSEYYEFDEINRKLSGPAGHRLLWHAVWRQPVLNRVQAEAVFVRGGERIGLHNELEGSLIISFNVNRVDIETRLWRNFFGAVQAGASGWQIPPQPFPMQDQDVRLPVTAVAVREVYEMNQVRSMVSNTLHYLDHPALGVLVEVRPYQLPDTLSFE